MYCPSIQADCDQGMIGQFKDEQCVLWDKEQQVCLWIQHLKTMAELLPAKLLPVRPSTFKVRPVQDEQGEGSDK